MGKVWKVLIGLMVFCLTAMTALAGDPSTAPRDNEGKKWRIGYLEGGEYPDYQQISLMIVSGLMDLGWIEPMPLPKEYDKDHRRVWEWLADNAKSDYVEFVKDGFYTSHFDATQRPKTQENLLRRLNEQKDIDLILAMGTWAGQDLANDRHSVPTVVASTSNPVASKIIPGVDDSGFDHLHAKVEPDRYILQLRLFHDIIQFKSMGLVHEDSIEGRTFAAVADAELVAGERGFELKHCFARNNDVTIEEASAEVLACYEKLAPEVEAMYITVHRGEGLHNLPKLLEPLLKHEVPSFAMPGSEFVKHGALLSIAHAGFSYVARFHAETIAKIFNGAKPRDLTQKWSAPPKIAINLKTAEIIGFDPPFDILAAADEIFERIEPVQPK